MKKRLVTFILGKLVKYKILQGEVEVLYGETFQRLFQIWTQLR